MSDNITIKYNPTDDGTAIILEANDDPIADVEPGCLGFRITDNEPVVTFKPDGTVDINPKYTTTEAAQAFWRAVVALNPWRQ